jgi:hypothetical protein
MRSAEQPRQTAAALGLCPLLRSLWRLLSIEKGRPPLMGGAAVFQSGQRDANRTFLGRSPALGATGAGRGQCSRVAGATTGTAPVPRRAEGGELSTSSSECGCPHWRPREPHSGIDSPWTFNSANSLDWKKNLTVRVNVPYAGNSIGISMSSCSPISTRFGESRRSGIRRWPAETKMSSWLVVFEILTTTVDFDDARTFPTSMRAGTMTPTTSLSRVDWAGGPCSRTIAGLDAQLAVKRTTPAIMLRNSINALDNIGFDSPEVAVWGYGSQVACVATAPPLQQFLVGPNEDVALW